MNISKVKICEISERKKKLTLFKLLMHRIRLKFEMKGEVAYLNKTEKSDEFII